MDLSVILAFASALFALAMALTLAWHERRSLAYWAFIAGMIVLAAEGICSGLAADAMTPEATIYWQNWSLVAMALLPGPWLLFTLTYARGNYREFLVKWRLLLIAAFAAPIALALFSGGKFIALGHTTTGDHWILRLGAAGLGLYLLFLLSAVLVLMNLERTFRAAAGTMRWRIKFMVLGLAVLFAVRA